MNAGLKRAILAMIVIGLPLPSMAFDSYFCTGTIDSVGVNPDGTVQIDSSAAGLRYAKLCSLNATVNTGVNQIPPDTCKGVLATVLRAQATGATVQWGFLDASTCSGHTAWVQLTGWYYGPIVLNQ